MGIFAIIAIACGAALVGALATVAVVFLNREKINELFRELKQRNSEVLTRAEKDIIAFTMTDAINDPGTPIVEGIFNKRTQKVIDTLEITAERVAASIAAKHRRNEIVFYN